MHQSDRIHDMQKQPSADAYIPVRQRVVIVGVGVRNAAASGRDPVQTAFEKWLQEDGQRTRTGGLQRIDQLLGRSHLAGRDEVLHGGQPSG